MFDQQPNRGRTPRFGNTNNKGHINLCTVCSEPGTRLSSFTIDPLRAAPASTTYQRNDCSYSSDRDEYRCEAHYREPCLRGYSWGRTTHPLTRPDDHCCVVGCFGKAEYEIYGESGDPDDSTTACSVHVGDLLGTPSWRTPPNHSWTVAERARD